MQDNGIDPTGDAGDLLAKLSPTARAALGEAKARRDEENADRLDKLGEALKKSRSDAITARQTLGIDQQWLDDLEYYEGIDDANREELTGSSGSWHTKPPGQSMTGGLGKTGEVRSTVFVNVTRPYCDAAAARIGDMLMPTDDRAFSLKPTPVPDLEEIAKGKLSLGVKKDMLSQAQTQDQLGGVVQSAISNAKQKLAEARERAEKAQLRLDDWFVECQYHGEVRKVIDDCAKLGTGVLKGPVPVKRKSQKITTTPEGVMQLVIEEKIVPASRWVDPLNLFPDPACGENIHNGSYIWERDYLTKRKLIELKDMPGYLGAQIDKVIEEGPQKATSETLEPQGSARNDDIKDRYEVWYYHGILDREDFEALGCTCEPGADGELPESVFAILTMVNSTVIKGALNPLDTGDFPYDVMLWQRQSGRWTGVGVSRQIRTPQRMINAATRNMMDNAGLSAGPQIVMKLDVITPADGNDSITPRKIWYLSADADVNDLNAVFRTYNIDSKQEELMNIIQFGLKIAEDVTGLPLLMQGQQGKAPDTLGGMQILNNNSSTVLRRLAKLFDDGITEPHVRRYYVWLMQYGEDDAEKGDFQIDARGSSALVERDLQNQAVLQMGSLVLNPAFGIDPKKWYAEYCKSQRLDAKNFQYTEEEQKQLEQQAQQQGPTDPRVAVAQLRAQMDKDIATMVETNKQKILGIEQQFEAQQNALDRQLELMITELEESGKQHISISDIKARLADTAIKVRAQRDLSAQSNAVTLHTRATPRVVTPPDEPVGRAPAGQAYQR